MKLKLITMALAMTTLIGGTMAAQAGQHTSYDERRGAISIDRSIGKGHQIKQRGERHVQTLGPRQIERALSHRGYRNVRVTDVRRGNYVVRARGRHGPVVLLVNRRNAAVLHSRQLRPNRGYQRNFNGGSVTFHFGG